MTKSNNRALCVKLRASGLTLAAIGQRLGITRESVRNNLSRASQDEKYKAFLAEKEAEMALAPIEEAASFPVRNFHFSQRAWGVLHYEGIETLNDLRKTLNNKDLIRWVGGCGKKTIDEFETILKRYNL